MRRAEELGDQGGIRWFFATLVFALLIGLMFRVLFSPAKIESLVRAKLETLPVAEQLTFRSAELSLANGAWPDFALVLHELEWRPSQACAESAPARAKSIRIPLRFLSVIEGEPAAGVVRVSELILDLDRLKNGCANASTDPVVDKVTEKTIEFGKGEKGKTDKTAVIDPIHYGAGEVFSVDQSRHFARILRGVLLDRAEIFFEDRMKSVVLENFRASWSGRTPENAKLDFHTSVHFPPSTVFGENLPAFTVSGILDRHQIVGDVRADLNEGNLEASVTLKPIVGPKGQKELAAELGISVSDLPLSVMTPLLTKSGIVVGAFRPKFVWLDCSADIHGVFSRLFIDNPLNLSQCEVSGQIGRLVLEKAARNPDGRWRAFEVVVSELSVDKFLDVFDAHGPVGTFSDMGKLEGKLTVDSDDQARFAGRLRGAVARIAGGDGVALQPFEIETVEAQLRGKTWDVLTAEFKPAGGEADVEMRGRFDLKANVGKADLVVKHLKLSQRVEKVLMTGPIEDVQGKASASIEAGRLKQLTSNFTLKNVSGDEFRADELDVVGSGKSAENGVAISIQAKSPKIDVVAGSALHKLLQPSLLGWNGGSDEVLPLKRVAINGRFSDEAFQWQKTSASIAGLVNLATEGQIEKGNQLVASVEAQFPNTRRLKWKISGSWFKPLHEADSPELVELLRRNGAADGASTATVSKKVLGL